MLRDAPSRFGRGRHFFRFTRFGAAISLRRTRSGGDFFCGSVAFLFPLITMWPFRRRREKKGEIMKNLVVGLIIGTAITSIIGKKMMEKHEVDEDDETDED